MLVAWAALFLAIIYLSLLFAVASWGDRRAEQGRSPIASPYAYALSLAVYCTAWTFYGSVGLATSNGLAFLPIYLGPTLAALTFPFIIRKMLRITKAYGITSIADFISARYGKSGLLGGLVTVVAVIGAVPYISLQLKAVAASVDIMLGMSAEHPAATIGADTALIVTLVLAAFSILFGTRHIDATEHHPGMVLAVAFESVVKLVCFLAVGIFVSFVLFDSPAQIMQEATRGGFSQQLTIPGSGLSYWDWSLLVLLSAFAFVVLPRQFQVAVIENLDDAHLRKATWLLPLYLFVINIFVIPIALAGLVLAVPVAGADRIVLALPISQGHYWLAFLAFLGGLSAATAMVIVETVALSTMVSNDLVMPVLLRLERFGLNQRPDLTGLVLMVRRIGILVLLVLGYVFFRLIGSRYGLASIGLISFAAVAQFAPLIIAGIYWKESNLKGAIWGLCAGTVVWFYTLILPTFAQTTGPFGSLVEYGPFGIGLLRPEGLFGLTGMHPVAHAVVWSMSANIACILFFGLLGRQDKLERLQAILFVDVDQSRATTRLWRGEARVGALRDLLVRFLGSSRGNAVLAVDATRRGRQVGLDERADSSLVQLTERQLARAIGAASARVVVASVVRGEMVGPDALMDILDETSKVMEYSRQLEQKSQALEEATAELRAANERLQQLDRLKDDFLATVSHELRTPLTSIRSFSEILLDAPDLSEEERAQFLGIVIRESERLTRLINDVLDLSKIESGRMEWHVTDCDLKDILQDSVAASKGLLSEKTVLVDLALAPDQAPVSCDRDRLIQVVINLISNACKFVPEDAGRVRVTLDVTDGSWRVRVEDNGPGVPPEWREAIFDKFRQVADDLKSRPKGSGLGLTICRQIVEHFGGNIWVEDAKYLTGAAVCFTLPAARAVGEPALAAE